MKPPVPFPFTIAPPSRLRKGVGTGECPVYLRKVDVHTGFYKLGRDQLARLTAFETLLNVFDDARPVLCAHPSR